MMNRLVFLRFSVSCICAFLICLALSIQPTICVALQEADAAERTISAPASVRGYQTADLYAKVGGYITEMLVDIGDKVEKGQPLAEIDVPELKKQVLQKENRLLLARAEAEQAEARVVESEAQLAGFEAAVTEAASHKSEKSAKLEFEEKDCTRITKLVSRGAIQQEIVDAAMLKCQAARSAVNSADAAIATARARLAGAKAAVVRAGADVKAAEAQIKVAESDLDYVNELLNYTTIRAPFKGEVAKRMYDAGAFVQNAEGNSGAKAILQIVRTDKVRVAFSLSMSDIAGLDRGDKVLLSRIDALPGESFEGTVSRFAAGLDSQTRMMNVEVDLDNKEGKLMPGFFGYVSLFPGQR